MARSAVSRAPKADPAEAAPVVTPKSRPKAPKTAAPSKAAAQAKPAAAKATKSAGPTAAAKTSATKSAPPKTSAVKASPAAKPAPKRAAAKAKAPDGNGAAHAKSANGASAPKANGHAPEHMAQPTPPTEAAPPKESPTPKPEAPEAGTAGAAQAENPFLTPEVEAFAVNMASLWDHGGKALTALMKPREEPRPMPGDQTEVMDLVKTLGQVAERWMADPQRVAEAQRAFTGDFLTLWANTMRRLSGEEVEKPVIEAEPTDKRFKDPAWSEHPVFDFLKQAYLHAARWGERMVEQADDLDEHTRHKANFYVKLLSNAASPSNFLPTNPELLRETLQSKGENLVRGMQFLSRDIDPKGELRIRQTDIDHFEVGRNLATTPGKVVYQNEIFQLLQYSPTTETVRTRPLVIVPPWINKFYILDLTAEKSLIRWCVDQGLTVFCISWVNPDERHADKGFDDYMRDGIMRAIDVAREVCEVDQVDAVGYCVGGTLLSITLAYMAKKGMNKIATATLFTAQIDFTYAGDLKVFVDEEQISAVEARMREVGGYLEGSRMANAFNMLRSNDLIWPYVVNNYMRGKPATAFDLLYWNSDATRMPARNHSFYLRNCYFTNDLGRGAMEIYGEILNPKDISVPIYAVATKEDHIAPAKSVFFGIQKVSSEVRFVLAGSGHIAGVVNPPAKMKYQHWIGGAPAGELSEWAASAQEKPGSWWPDWRAWLDGHDATRVKARIPGEGLYPAIEDAPGSYVKVKA